jgi:hypothetical protein
LAAVLRLALDYGHRYFVKGLVELGSHMLSLLELETERVPLPLDALLETASDPEPSADLF